MSRTRFGLVAVALAGAAAAGIAFAQPAPAGREFTRDQARAGAEQLFAAMDLNHDGKLDAADREVRMSRMFDRIDTNHDGSISRAEFLSAHRDGGDHHAANEPGGPAGMMRMRAMAMGGRILREADPQHTGSVTRDAFINAALVLFDRADANHDGKLTAQERRAAMAGAMRGPDGMGGHRGMGGMGGMDGHGDDMMPPPGE